jgi:hypothetical protein
MPPGPAFGRPEDRLSMVEGGAADSVPCGRPLHRVPRSPSPICDGGGTHRRNVLRFMPP